MRLGAGLAPRWTAGRQRGVFLVAASEEGAALLDRFA
jgi:hypothetical protein